MVFTGLSVGWFTNEEKSPILSFTTQGVQFPYESVSKPMVLDTLLKHNIIFLTNRGQILFKVRDTHNLLDYVINSINICIVKGMVVINLAKQYYLSFEILRS